MAALNSTIDRVDGLRTRASEELRAAGDALHRTGVLLQAIEREFMGGATMTDAEIDVFALVQIALELAKTSADRAAGEADHFAKAVQS
ncbi:hypothetical protein [Burkholderia pseudomallei]|uniref:hypothetical protein n=1 Tax=Burkholderia pseudomallei TaxID=28450 RepID=UPI000978AEA2|nr:hypothetical protein [Burkholderia pseudomallei]MBD2915554.1 hypothetical protein [Burkholderia pseudomallei]MBD2920021.1 hypothetical protein [Burkholderia pseudomallei]MBD2927707.1 hypothetical protein [Burkholderia pseudomallei]MBD2930385.1 hypothetical protein [Burkholderia pseudomallei]MBD2967051.1 hypothetical protein [Burkholderia pseudomallei]